MVTVLVGPESVKGFAVLVKDAPNAPDTLWVYLLPVRREYYDPAQLPEVAAHMHW